MRREPYRRIVPCEIAIQPKRRTATAPSLLLRPGQKLVRRKNYLRPLECVGASYIPCGTGLANVIIAMLIAGVKASLVALFFMHLRWDRPVNAIVFCSTLFFLGLFA